MLERRIEQALYKRVSKSGGLCLKFVSPGFKGAPDRLVLLPGGRLLFIELKAPGKNLTPLQQKRKTQIESLGFVYLVVDSLDGVERVAL